MRLGMDKRTVLARTLVVVTAILLSACMPKDSASPDGTQSWQTFEMVQQSVVGATGRTASDIEVAGNKHRIVVFVMSPPAAGTDLAAMQAEAARIAAAVAGAVSARTDLSGVQAVNVSYIHKSGTSDEHTDDVFDYRRDAAGGFTLHVT
jgi:hypothetical protein